MADNFIDFDAFTIGFIVALAQALFDRYWNADAVYPIHAVTRSPLGAEVLRQKFEDRTGPKNAPPPVALTAVDVLGYAPISEDLNRGRLALTWAHACVFADHPDKPFDGEAGGEAMETSVTCNVFEALRKAETEIVVSSPYPVPGKDGMALIRELGARCQRCHADQFPGIDQRAGGALGLLRLPRTDARPWRGASRNQLVARQAQQAHEPVRHVAQPAARQAGGGRPRDHLRRSDESRSAFCHHQYRVGCVFASPELAQELVRVIDIDRLQNTYRVRHTASGRELGRFGCA